MRYMQGCDAFTLPDQEEIAHKIGTSARFATVAGKLAMWVEKALQVDARAQGPTDPDAFVPYTECLRPEDSVFCSGDGASLVQLARSNVGRVSIDSSTRRMILKNPVYVQNSLRPLQVRRLNAQASGKPIDSVIGPVTRVYVVLPLPLCVSPFLSCLSLLSCVPRAVYPCILEN
jgi:hypothetical protein